MDYLQYLYQLNQQQRDNTQGFKPCYKWITFNTYEETSEELQEKKGSFKPCYKWITFNTMRLILYPNLQEEF